MTREVKFTDRTVQIFHAPPGGAKPTVGYFIRVRWEEGSETIPEKALMDPEDHAVGPRWGVAGRR